MFCLNLASYGFLLLFWVRSVQQRLLPGRKRSYMIAATLCAVAMLLLRSIKYRMIDGMSFEMLRYAWYLYYVPMTLMPALFLMTCIRIERGENSRFDEWLLLIPTGVVILLFLTNDLHYFAFRPVGEQNQMTGANGSYTNAPLFYIYYAFFAVCIIAGLVLLTKANSRFHSFIKIALPFIFLLIMAALVMLDKVLNIANKPSMFTTPEIIAFCMVGVFLVISLGRSGGRDGFGSPRYARTALLYRRRHQTRK